MTLLERIYIMNICFFAAILTLIFSLIYYKDNQVATVYIDHSNQCIIVYKNKQYYPCSKLKNDDLEYILKHYNVVKFSTIDEDHVMRIE